MSIDREALAKAVAEHSPLTMAQIEAMFGADIAQNKRALWEFLQKPAVHQKSAWQTFLRVQHYFPEAAVLATRPLEEQIASVAPVQATP